MNFTKNTLGGVVMLFVLIKSSNRCKKGGILLYLPDHWQQSLKLNVFRTSRILFRTVLTINGGSI